MAVEHKRDQQPTINDVARIAGVSKKTVSRVINRSPLLNKDTRERVESVIARLGYVPNPQARALALRRNFLIGLLHDNPNAQMVLNFQEGVLEAIRETEFALVVRPVDRHSPAMLNDVRTFLEKQRLFGVLILPPISENDELAALCRELGCGYVRMGSAKLDDEAHLVESNDRHAVGSAIDYLVDQGHPAGFVMRIRNTDASEAAQQARQVLLAAERLAAIHGNDFVDAVAEDETAIQHRHTGFGERGEFAVEVDDRIVHGGLSNVDGESRGAVACPR